MIAKLSQLVPDGGRPFCEPFCGGASLFFSRAPAPVEVLNDLNRDVVNLFRVLQNRDTFEELRHRIMWTPYAVEEFQRAIDMPDEASEIDKAWATFVRFNQGFGGKSKTRGDWGRVFVSNAQTAGTTNTWLMRLSMLDAFHRRLMRVQIDCCDAIKAIAYWDADDAVFYVDPPYVHATRVKQNRNEYAYEMDNADHERLVTQLLQCRGAVVLSGYDHEIYKPLADAGWTKHQFSTACHAAGRVRGSKLRGVGSATQHVKRVECVWQKPRAKELCNGGSDESRLDF